MEIVIATNNEDKVKEYKEILKELNATIYSLKDLNIEVDPDETGKTFSENSLIKAKAIQKYTDKIIISDDSGLVIDALPDLLGVFSKRFMGANLTYKQKCEEIIKLLEGKVRTARFICCLTILNLTNEPLQFEGVCEGSIGYELKGSNGFGFDPIFVPLNYDVSISQLSNDEKNSISHRGLACQKLLKYLKENKVGE